MNLEIMLLGLLIASTLTGLATEAIKKILAEYQVKYHANMLAGVVSLVLSVSIGCGYIIQSGTPWTEQAVIYVIALVFLSWLCAMVGYDKVIQSISQFTSKS